MLEIANIYTVEGHVYEGGVEHKNILTTGDRVNCLYYKLPSNPQKDVMDGAHAHRSESVLQYATDGDLDVYVAGETATLKKGDLITIQENTVLGTKVLSSTPGEVLIVASANTYADWVTRAKKEGHQIEAKTPEKFIMRVSIPR